MYGCSSFTCVPLLVFLASAAAIVQHTNRGEQGGTYIDKMVNANKNGWILGKSAAQFAWHRDWQEAQRQIDLSMEQMDQANELGKQALIFVKSLPEQAKISISTLIRNAQRKILTNQNCIATLQERVRAQKAPDVACFPKASAEPPITTPQTQPPTQPPAPPVPPPTQSSTPPLPTPSPTPSPAIQVQVSFPQTLNGKYSSSEDIILPKTRLPHGGLLAMLGLVALLAAASLARGRQRDISGHTSSGFMPPTEHLIRAELLVTE